MSQNGLRLRFRMWTDYADGNRCRRLPSGGINSLRHQVQAGIRMKD